MRAHVCGIALCFSQDDYTEESLSRPNSPVRPERRRSPDHTLEATLTSRLSAMNSKFNRLIADASGAQSVNTPNTTLNADSESTNDEAFLKSKEGVPNNDDADSKSIEAEPKDNEVLSKIKEAFLKSIKTVAENNEPGTVDEAENDDAAGTDDEAENADVAVMESVENLMLSDSVMLTG